MKSTNGTSLPMVRAFTTSALCRMPRTFTHANAANSTVRTRARAAPVAIHGK
jgi:hypothetical protein